MYICQYDEINKRRNKTTLPSLWSKVVRTHEIFLYRLSVKPDRCDSQLVRQFSQLSLIFNVCTVKLLELNKGLQISFIYEFAVYGSSGWGPIFSGLRIRGSRIRLGWWQDFMFHDIYIYHSTHTVPALRKKLTADGCLHVTDPADGPFFFSEQAVFSRRTAKTLYFSRQSSTFSTDRRDAFSTPFFRIVGCEKYLLEQIIQNQSNCLKWANKILKFLFIYFQNHNMKHWIATLPSWRNLSSIPVELNNRNSVF